MRLLKHEVEETKLMAIFASSTDAITVFDLNGNIDTGVGIPKENMNKLFTPFFTTKAKCMGMGLAIYKKFVESHGGKTLTAKLLIQQENGGENQ